MVTPFHSEIGQFHLRFSTANHSEMSQITARASARRAAALAPALAAAPAGIRGVAGRPTAGGRSAVVARAGRRAPVVAASDLPPKVDELIATAKDTWEETENKPTVISAAGITLIGLTALDAILNRLNGIPFLPFILQSVGTIYTGYFVYRYLLFKPDREELLSKVDDLKGKIF